MFLKPAWPLFGRIVRCALLAVCLAARTAQGAQIDWDEARQFWSFQRPVKQALPKVKHRSWPQERLDYFVLATMEAKGLAPTQHASKRTLIRRATLDITGLPPTPEAVEAFLKDRKADAYERLVERLLSSKTFGERLASLWLPLARYAEDQAHQVGDDTKYFYPNAYRYRDWVIESFNSDLPYDQFLKYQLAADKYGEAGQQHLAALGFLGLGPKYYNRNRIEVMADEWEDRVDTVSRTMLGLTVACARCHQHKFDPITTADYYALAGVFASTKMVNQTADGGEEGKDADAKTMKPETLHMVTDGEVKNLNIFLRGNPERPGSVAERRFLKILSAGEPEPFKDGSGRRELADAIACESNPLTARVFVNRVWGAFFGRALAPTQSNFGNSGQPPSHPELLDDLAVRFTEQGWSVKTLVRELVLSATYQQASVATGKRAAAANQIDPENIYLSRMNRKRLSIEQWRDATLFVTGELKDESGRSLELDDPKNLRRTVYARVSRLKLNDILMQFDYPDANVHAEGRSVTTTPTQKLFMLNNPFVQERASSFARQIDSGSTKQKVERAYLTLFGRAPDKWEVEAASKYLAGADDAEFTRWERYTQALMASNEFMYVD